jgi:hypothetical protein
LLLQKRERKESPDLAPSLGIGLSVVIGTIAWAAAIVLFLIIRELY